MTEEVNSREVLFQMKQVSNRLDRFEKQLDEVRVAIVQMAKTEERVSMVLEQNTTLFRKCDELSRQVNDMKTQNATQQQSLGFFERLGWVVVTAAVGLAAWFMRS